jgi:membrane complex biogenesis BtpA family protein
LKGSLMSAFRLVGVLHLPPLPGAMNYSGQSVSEIARVAAEDARVLALAGFTDVMVQDASDNPQPTLANTATIASLAAIGAIVREATDVSLGVVVGHNDGPASVAIAHAIGAQFVRVKVLTGVSPGPDGWIQGCAMEVASMKRLLASDVEVWADAHEATSKAVTGDVCWAASEALSFGGADRIIITRDRGVADAVTDIAAVKSAVGAGVSVLIGGRVSLSSLDIAMRGADGAILGSALKDGSGYAARIDPEIAKRFGDEFRAFAA